MKYLLALLLIACAGHKPIEIRASVKIDQPIHEAPAVHARLPVRPIPQNRLLVARPTPRKPVIRRPIVRPPVLPIPQPFQFATGRAKASLIPRLWLDSVTTLCKAHRIVIAGSSSPDGSKARNHELATLRAQNTYKAVLLRGCPEKNLAIAVLTGGKRSVSIEVIKP